MQQKSKLFISYSQQDKLWLDKLHTFLDPLTRSLKISYWDNSLVQAGSDWQKEIDCAIECAEIALLLVSPNFLANEYIISAELPKIIRREKDQNLVIFWIAISSCLYQESDLINYKAANNPKLPLDVFQEHEQNQILSGICEKIKCLILSENKSSKKDKPLKKIKQEIAPDDWDKDPNSLFEKIKTVFKNKI